MNIPIFLSHPQPHQSSQQAFLSELKRYLQDRGLEPRTLGVTDYDMQRPLAAIRALMMQCSGLISVAFRRTYVATGEVRKDADIEEQRKLMKPVRKSWLTSPYAHIEPAMAFQLGLPIVILREQGVFADGVVEKGVVGLYMPEFDLDDNNTIDLTDPEWSELLAGWERDVRVVARNRSEPPKLY